MDDPLLNLMLSDNTTSVDARAVWNDPRVRYEPYQAKGEAMPDKPWKAHERKAAAMFGTKRKIGSGCQGRDDATRSDSNHERLFIECKTRAKSAVRSLMTSTAELANREDKVPVLVLRETGKPGSIVCVREQDLAALVVEYAAANHAAVWPLIVAAINRRDGIEPGDFALPRQEDAC